MDPLLEVLAVVVGVAVVEVAVVEVAAGVSTLTMLLLVVILCRKRKYPNGF